MDVNPKAVTMARLNLWTRFAQEPVETLPLPALADIVVQGDALGTEAWSDIPQTYDVVLGNPPFLATSRVPDRDQLPERFETARGRYDYSYLFVELALNRLRETGVLSMVVPNRLFRNRNAAVIRRLLTSKADLLVVVDFGGNQVFDGTSAYIGSVTARKHADDSAEPANMVRAIIVSSLPFPFVAASLADACRGHDEVKTESLAAYDVVHPRGDDPWMLLSPTARVARARLEEISDPIDTVAGIYQGIRTGANDIFIVDARGEGAERLAAVTNGLGDPGVVERDLLRPVIFGSDIQRYDTVRASQYILYPYRSGAAIPESELRERWPRAWSYLCGYREILASRGSIRQGGLKWFELVRKRDAAWLNKPKLLIRDLAPGPSFAVDLTGPTYLVGGAAVVPHDPELLLPLLTYLNGTVISRFLEEHTPSFRGGCQRRWKNPHFVGLEFPSFGWCI